MSMKIAIVHYHLRRGGVRRIIDHTLTALSDDDVNIAVISGEKPDGALARDIPLGIIPGLNYQTQISGDLVSSLPNHLEEEAKRLLGDMPDVWHFHNHSLGKNPALTAAVRNMADNGHKLLLQIHDFAEDGRPENYRCLLDQLAKKSPYPPGDVLYPSASHVHYAFINRRDLDYMANAGATAKQLHFLPNPVSLPEDLADDFSPALKEEPPLLLYPARAIRRKNIGEFILWAASMPHRYRFGITLAPKNPVHRPVYDRWIQFTRSLHLPVEFGLGEKKTFAHLLRNTKAVITTSVAEGFGMSFLEPWLAGKPLAGRNLPRITTDFKRMGVNLEKLYERLTVPVEIPGKEKIQKHIRQALPAHYKSYGLEADRDVIEATEESLLSSGRVDFGRLNEPLQEIVIRKAKESGDACELLAPSTLEGLNTHCRIIEENREAVRANFSLNVYRDRLLGIYKATATSGTDNVTSLSTHTLLKNFLSPESFSLLETDTC
jgi:glycosyltransferase involved in cell wall biosynthesis